METTMGAVAILDIEHFRNMTGDDTALQAEIIALFRGQAQIWRCLIMPSSPLQTWCDAVHTVKGSARSLGLWGLAEACERAEAAGKAGAPGSPAIAHAIAQVRAALDQALDALPNLEAANS